MTPSVPTPSSNLSCESMKKWTDFSDEMSNPPFPNKNVFLSTGLPVVDSQTTEDDIGSFAVNNERQESKEAPPKIKASRKISLGKGKEITKEQHQHHPICFLSEPSFEGLL
ncbi:hypothetical protein I3843_16G036600 [Carya illinoinensis]|nr:hypothetical protein I3843_16G036600 [Carya illinoinensis]